jgi:adenylosuccinate lyase
MQVYPEVIHRIMMQNLPFYATENILMEAVKRGGNRQHLHEVIREYAMKQVAAVREGRDFDMLQALRESQEFNLPDEVWEKISDLSQYVGRAPWQVEELLAEYIDPLLEKYQTESDIQADIRV